MEPSVAIARALLLALEDDTLSTQTLASSRTTAALRRGDLARHPGPKVLTNTSEGGDVASAVTAAFPGASRDSTVWAIPVGLPEVWLAVTITHAKVVTEAVLRAVLGARLGRTSHGDLVLIEAHHKPVARGALVHWGAHARLVLAHPVTATIAQTLHLGLRAVQPGPALGARTLARVVIANTAASAVCQTQNMKRVWNRSDGTIIAVVIGDTNAHARPTVKDALARTKVFTHVNATTVQSKVARCTIAHAVQALTDLVTALRTHLNLTRHALIPRVTHALPNSVVAMAVDALGALKVGALGTILSLSISLVATA